MDTELLIQNAIASVLSNLGAKGTEIGLEKIKSWVERSKIASATSIGREINDIDNLAESVYRQYESKSGQRQYNSEILAR